MPIKLNPCQDENEILYCKNLIHLFQIQEKIDAGCFAGCRKKHANIPTHVNSSKTAITHRKQASHHAQS